MANAKTEHSKKLRQETADRRAEEVIAAGGWRLRLLLQPDAAQALRDEMTRTGETATAIIGRLLIKKN
mgnify:CR=1 FL=1